MERVISYKESLKDIICLRKDLKKQHSWVLNEVTAVDYDPKDKEGLLYRVVCEYIDLKNVII